MLSNIYLHYVLDLVIRAAVQDEYREQGIEPSNHVLPDLSERVAEATEKSTEALKEKLRNGSTDAGPRPAAAPEARSANGNKISEAQIENLFAIAMKAGKAKGMFEEHAKLRLRDWLRNEFNIDRTSEILVSQYEGICRELEAGEMFNLE